jgi:hypothetical protein
MLSRFDGARLAPVDPASAGPRSCARSRAIVATCRLGAGPATRPWAEPGGAVRIEWPFGVLQTDDAAAARRAALQLAGSWRMADASAAGRLAIRAAALWADLAWWRALREGDAWDSGVVREPGTLAGFMPRRATLVLIDGDPGDAGLQALAALEQRAWSLPRALRVLVVGGRPGIGRPV